MKFELDVWYVGALDREVGPGMVGRTIANKEILIFRKQSGDVAAIADYCPHRFAPLSMGKIVGDFVQCPYHGLEFDGQGRCVKNPQSDLIAPNAHIPAFPVIERYGFVWVWLGDAALADDSLIPDLSPFVTTETQEMASQYMLANYRYDVLVDNLLDFTHVTYVHAGSFSTGPGTEQEFHSEIVGDRVDFSMVRHKAPAPPRDRDLGEIVDEQYLASWYPGNVMPSVKSTVATGEPFESGRKTIFGHIATPQDNDKTHYFMYATRFHELGNEAVSDQFRAYQRSVVDGEDGPVLEAVHRRMKGAELMDLRPLVLEGDAGDMRVRRVISRRLKEEEKRNAEREAAKGASKFKQVEEAAVLPN